MERILRDFDFFLAANERRELAVTGDYVFNNGVNPVEIKTHEGCFFTLAANRGAYIHPFGRITIINPGGTASYAVNLIIGFGRIHV